MTREKNALLPYRESRNLSNTIIAESIRKLVLENNNLLTRCSSFTIINIRPSVLKRGVLYGVNNYLMLDYRSELGQAIEISSIFMPRCDIHYRSVNIDNEISQYSSTNLINLIGTGIGFYTLFRDIIP